ncbi:MAG: tetratricopeptide repeat protein [Candidatus Anstonellaceae archaeon]
MKKISEKDFIIIYNQGVKNYKEGDYQKAIENFQILIKQNPKDPQIKIALASSYNNNGVKFYKENKISEALEMFKKAFELEPTNPQYLENIKIAERKIKEQKFYHLTMEAYAYFQNKEYEKALKRLLDAKNIQPNNEAVDRALAATYNAIGIKKYLNRKFKEAVKYFELAKKSNPANPKYEQNIKVVQNLMQKNLLNV